MAKAKTPTTKTAAKKATQSKRRTAKTNPTKKSEAAETEVVMDRRRENRRGKSPAGAKSDPSKSGPSNSGPSNSGPSKSDASKPAEKPTMERRAKVNRRRQIDPTTCERDYSNDEIEFMQALDAYKRANGRMFPTCSEILEVVRGLGYQRGPVQVQAEELAETGETDQGDASVPAITDDLSR